MGRLNEDERGEVTTGYKGHWEEADALGDPILIVAPDPEVPGDPGFGRPQFVALVDQYEALTEEIAELVEGELPTLRSERDALFGKDNEDFGGVWFRLLQYKMLVKARLGTRHPLFDTVPNIGDVTPDNLLKILDRFIRHWTRVNAALASPLVLGDPEPDSLSLEQLIQRRDDIDAKIERIDDIETSELPHKRAQREALFGDVSEKKRLETSIIARMLLYRVIIESRFPGQPIALSLPEIFPGESTASLPTFRYFFTQTAEGDVILWFLMPDGVVGVVAVFMKEGVEEFSTVVSLEPGQSQQVTWPGVTIVDGVDEVTLRDEEDRDVAIGVEDPTLPDPGP